MPGVSQQRLMSGAGPGFWYCFGLLFSVTLGKMTSSHRPLPLFFFLFFQFQNTVDSTVCLTEVSSLEGIYPVEDMRPTIISQLENQRSAQRPLTGEKKLRRPLKSKSDLRRWESGRRPCTGILKIRFPGSVQPFFFFFFFMEQIFGKWWMKPSSKPT